MYRGLGGAFALLLAVAAFVLPSIAATKSAELDKAVEALKQEYAAHVKSPESNSLRSACDYFKDKAVAIPPRAVLDVLERPLGGGRMRTPDAQRQTAYVKWQLLSALPESLDVKTDAETVARLLKIYEHSPVPRPRYTCASAEKRELDVLLNGARPQDDVSLTAELEAAVKRAFDADAPVIAYRDELYHRLPTGRAKFMAALRDAHTRVMFAAPKDKLVESLARDLPTWAISAADDERGQVREVAEVLGKLRFVESTPYYASAGVRKGRLTWVTDTDTLLSRKKLADLHKALLDAANAPLTGTAAGGGGKKAGANKKS